MVSNIEGKTLEDQQTQAANLKANNDAAANRAKSSNEGGEEEESDGLQDAWDQTQADAKNNNPLGKISKLMKQGGSKSQKHNNDQPDMSEISDTQTQPTSGVSNWKELDSYDQSASSHNQSQPGGSDFGAEAGQGAEAGAEAGEAAELLQVAAMVA